MSKNQPQQSKGAATGAAKQQTSAGQTAAAPKPPSVPDTSTLPVTDPRRKLSKAELKQLTPEQKRARKEARYAARPPLKVRMGKRAEKLAKRVGTLAKIFEGQKDIEDSFTRALGLLKNAAGGIGELPADWKPARSARATAEPKFTVGQLVRMIEEKRPQYAAFFDDAKELNELTVKKVDGAKVLVQTESGTKLLLPSSAFKAVEA